MVLGVYFLELNVIEFVVVIKHFAHIGFDQLASVNVKALVVELFNDIVHSLQLLPYLLAIFSLYFDVLEKLTKISFPEFGESV